MDFLNLRCFLVVLVAVLGQLSTAVKLDENVGSNWRVSNSESIPADSKGYRSTQSVSSFSPTATVTTTGVKPQSGSSGAVDYSNYYYQVPSVDSSGKEYQIYQYQPNGNYYNHAVPSAGAEQRQEFFDQSSTVGDGDGSGISSLGGITNGFTGAASNLGAAFGLGGLGVLGGIIVAIFGVPLLVLIILFPIAILVLAIFALPVLAVTLPGDPTARNINPRLFDTVRAAKEVLQSEECVERLSCTLARKSRKLPYENWVLTKMNNATNVLASRVSKSVQLGRSGGNCEVFKCAPVIRLQKAYDSVVTSFRKNQK